MPTLFYVLLVVSVVYSGVVIYFFYRKTPPGPIKHDPGCFLTILSLVLGVVGLVTGIIVHFTEGISWRWLIIPGVLLIPIVVIIVDLATSKGGGRDYDEDW